jgi:hypothetical protein
MTTSARRTRKQRPAREPIINQAAIDLLRSWCEVNEEEAQEQRETVEALSKGIDAERARLGMRLLFS